jgi:hypothetical protein
MHHSTTANDAGAPIDPLYALIKPGSRRERRMALHVKHWPAQLRSVNLNLWRRMPTGVRLSSTQSIFERA